MADQRNSDIIGRVQEIRDLAYTGQNNRRATLIRIEQIASKLVTELTGDSDGVRTPSPVIPRREPAPQGRPTLARSATVSGAPSADDLKAAQKADEEQRKAAEAAHNQQLAEMQDRKSVV